MHQIASQSIFIAKHFQGKGGGGGGGATKPCLEAGMPSATLDFSPK